MSVRVRLGVPIPKRKGAEMNRIQLIAMIRRVGTNIVIGPYEGGSEFSVLNNLRNVAFMYGIKASFSIFYV